MSILQEKQLELPKWNLRKVERTARDMYESVFVRWLGEKLHEQVLSFLVDDCAESLGLTSQRQYSALIDTFCQDIDKTLDKPLLLRMSLQLTVNRGVLLDGQPLHRFDGVSEPEWVPFIVCAMTPCSFGAKPGLRLLLRVIAGQYAGYSTERSVPVGFLTKLAYDVGFSRRLQYEQPADLIGLMFAGLAVPTTESELQFEDYKVSAAMKKANRDLIKQRQEEEL